MKRLAGGRRQRLCLPIWTARWPGNSSREQEEKEGEEEGRATEELVAPAESVMHSADSPIAEATGVQLGTETEGEAGIEIGTGEEAGIDIGKETGTEGYQEGGHLPTLGPDPAVPLP